MVQSTKPDVLRLYSKYIFLDVVQFSTRSAEAQSEIVHQLNVLVRQALESCEVKVDDRILIPTGDGLCIALISQQLPYDIHIQLASVIVASLNEYDEKETNESRRFQVRIGINQNTDIMVKDINERDNLAGAGINMASRIMDKADGSQILISQTVHDELQPSEKYMGNFKPFEARGTHGLTFRLYQYVAKDCPGLNCETPSEFVKKTAAEPKLTRKVAYYFAHAIKLKKSTIRKMGYGQENYSLTVLLWLLAEDSNDKYYATEISPHNPKIYGQGKLHIDDVFNYYNSIDFWIIQMLSDYILRELSEYSDYLSEGGFGLVRLFVNGKGNLKLKREWPDIWKELELDKFVEIVSPKG